MTGDGTDAADVDTDTGTGTTVHDADAHTGTNARDANTSATPDTDAVRVGVDVGGTFTDVVLLTPDGHLTTAKVPSTADQSVGVVEGIEKACETAGVDPSDVGEFVHAMTVSTNALLERDGARAALVTTEGFRDVLEIGRQARPDLYDVDADKPDPLVPRRRRFEVTERTRVDGVERPVDTEAVEALAETLAERDVESVAVSFLHSYRDPENERRAAETLRAALDVPVSVSSEVLGEFREYERTATTAVDAYVRPTIDGYLGRLTERARDLGVPEPRVMQSNGGIADAETVRKRAVTTALSGPAAGVVGAGLTAESASRDRDREGLITFDMGGTSSDVSLVRDGAAERTTDTEIGGVPIGLPMVDVTTVGAGGGSVAWVDPGGALRVGPRSAGADPGPACYGQGGTEPTVTDANLVLGYIGESTALGGELSLDADAAAAALERLADAAGLADALEAARGVHRVANATMTRAIRAMTIERGHDPRAFALVAFGGAGPMHAATLAERLDVDTVVVPRGCGVLSALGLLGADEKHDAVRTHRAATGEADGDAIERVFDELGASVRGETNAPEAAVVEYSADLRYAGQSFELDVPVERPVDPTATERRFHAIHERVYGYRMDETVEFVNVRATATVRRTLPALGYDARDEGRLGERAAVFGEGRRTTPVYARGGVATAGPVDGPAIVEETESTVVVPPGWTASAEPDGTLVVSRDGGDGVGDDVAADGRVTDE